MDPVPKSCFELDKDDAAITNPFALIFVNADTLKNGKLDPAFNVEPLILRANAGDWIEVTLGEWIR